MRPAYPDALLADLVAISSGVDARSSVLEVGWWTGQATRSSATSSCSGDRRRAGEDLAVLARQRLAVFLERLDRDVVLRDVEGPWSAIRLCLWLHPRGTGWTP